MRARSQLLAVSQHVLQELCSGMTALFSFLLSVSMCYENYVQVYPHKMDRCLLYRLYIVALG